MMPQPKGRFPMLAIRKALRTFVFVALASFALSAQTPQAPSAPTARVAPASVGVSTERLTRLHDGMQGFVDRHEVSGIVTLVAREGKVVDLQAVGFADIDKNTPMKTDSIFRI